MAWDLGGCLAGNQGEAEERQEAALEGEKKHRFPRRGQSVHFVDPGRQTRSDRTPMKKVTDSLTAESCCMMLPSLTCGVDMSSHARARLRESKCAICAVGEKRVLEREKRDKVVMGGLIFACNVPVGVIWAWRFQAVQFHRGKEPISLF